VRDVSVYVPDECSAHYVLTDYRMATVNFRVPLYVPQFTLPTTTQRWRLRSVAASLASIAWAGSRRCVPAADGADRLDW
jgi:hypothetical protein